MTSPIKPTAQPIRETYEYTQAIVNLNYNTQGTTLTGTLQAENLKPNFAYQLKLEGYPGTVANEKIGLAGRWWQEEWNGNAWTNGQNLNDKGTGSSPNPNDAVYYSRRDIIDATSLIDLHYRFTGYLYLITSSPTETEMRQLLLKQEATTMSSVKQHNEQETLVTVY